MGDRQFRSGQKGAPIGGRGNPGRSPRRRRLAGRDRRYRAQLELSRAAEPTAKMTERTTSMPAALRRRRQYAGPTLFCYGFRPFFLGGALWAALGIVLWLPQYFGRLSLPTAFTPLDWHIHEMLYGYVAAIAAGFLLTAIPNWTGRLPVNGYPLAGLGALWLAGRVAVSGSAIWG